MNQDLQQITVENVLKEVEHQNAYIILPCKVTASNKRILHCEIKYEM